MGDKVGRLSHTKKENVRCWGRAQGCDEDPEEKGVIFYLGRSQEASWRKKHLKRKDGARFWACRSNAGRRARLRQL